MVNAGLKSEGIIPVDQFKDEEGQVEIKVGDQVDVALDTGERMEKLGYQGKSEKSPSLDRAG